MPSPTMDKEQPPQQVAVQPPTQPQQRLPISQVLRLCALAIPLAAGTQPQLVEPRLQMAATHRLLHTEQSRFMHDGARIRITPLLTMDRAQPPQQVAVQPPTQLQQRLPQSQRQPLCEVVTPSAAGSQHQLVELRSQMVATHQLLHTAELPSMHNGLHSPITPLLTMGKAQRLQPVVVQPPTQLQQRLPQSQPLRHCVLATPSTGGTHHQPVEPR